MKNRIKAFTFMTIVLFSACCSAFAAFAANEQSLNSNHQLSETKKEELVSIYSSGEQKNGCVNKLSEYIDNVDTSEIINSETIDKDTEIIYEIQNSQGCNYNTDEIKESLIENKIIRSAEDAMIDKNTEKILNIINRSDKYNFTLLRSSDDLYWLDCLEAGCDVYNDTSIVKSNDDRKIICKFLSDGYYNYSTYHYPEIDDKVIALRNQIESLIELPRGKVDYTVCIIGTEG